MKRKEYISIVKENYKTDLYTATHNVQTNNQLIVGGLAKSNTSSLSLLGDWVKERTSSLEKIVSSRLSVCVHKREHQLPGTINLDNFIHSKSDQKIIKICREDIEVKSPLFEYFLLYFSLD